MKPRIVLRLVIAFILSVITLIVIDLKGDPAWVPRHLSIAAGIDEALWQVQTTFLSVGFAGLAIAAQLFAETPLAIGASRNRVLEHIKADWFVGVGLVANVVIALEVLWFQSALGVLGVALFWFLPTLIMLVVSTMSMMQLFSNPSRLDELVRTSLTATLTTRLKLGTEKYVNAKKQLEGLPGTGKVFDLPNAATPSIRVPVPEAGRVIKMIRPKTVQQAIASLGIRATDGTEVHRDSIKMYQTPRIMIDVEPGDRTKLGETAFRVIPPKPLDAETNRRIALLLQSSIVFETTGAVTPAEEIDREIASLKDAIGTSLRSGAFATAERALDLLGRVVRGVWMAEPAALELTRRASLTRRDWLFRSLGEVEQDALLSPRAAGMFINAAMRRSLEAPKTDSMEYVDQCLASFLRLWLNILRYGDASFAAIPSQILLSVHNLTVYSYASIGRGEDLQARGIWTMVEMVKLALDAEKVASARIVAEALDELSDIDRAGTNRSHVQGGQLVLSGWLDYLAATKDARNPADPDLRELVMPRGKSVEIMEARRMAELGAARFSQWDWWETKTGLSSRAQARLLSRYIDGVQVEALSTSSGALPPIKDQEMASEYKRFLRLLDQFDRDLTAGETVLGQKLTEEIKKWDAEENERLRREPISPSCVEELHNSLRATLSEGPRIADEIPSFDDIHSDADASRPILGMNIRVPRHFLVEKVFQQTYADPQELGQVLAQGFIEAEDQKIIDALRSGQASILKPTITAISSEIEELGDAAKHFILLTPYGGVGSIYEWHSSDFTELLNRVTHIETGALHNEAILFERLKSLKSYHQPEEKDDLVPVPGTSIAVGVFEDVQDGDEPQVRLEAGEYFVVWPCENPNIILFSTEEVGDEKMPPKPRRSY